MKTQRLSVIREVLARASVTSQDELRRKLRRRGIHVTQATLSRDMHELRLSKGPSGYSIPNGNGGSATLESGERSAAVARGDDRQPRPARAAGDEPGGGGHGVGRRAAGGRGARSRGMAGNGGNGRRRRHGSGDLRRHTTVKRDERAFVFTWYPWDPRWYEFGTGEGKDAITAPAMRVYPQKNTIIVVMDRIDKPDVCISTPGGKTTGGVVLDFPLTETQFNLLSGN